MSLSWLTKRPYEQRETHTQKREINRNINEAQPQESGLAAALLIKMTHTYTHACCQPHVELMTAAFLAAFLQTAGALLADTGLIDSLLPRAIKDLIGEKIGPAERGHVEKTEHVFGGGGGDARLLVCMWVCFPAMLHPTTRRCERVVNNRYRNIYSSVHLHHPCTPHHS